MDEFRAALGQYLVGAMEVADLEQAVDQALLTGGETGSRLTRMLDDLYNGGRLPHQIYAVLKRRIDQHLDTPAAGGQGADATRLQATSEPGDAGAPAADDATRFAPRVERSSDPGPAIRDQPIAPTQPGGPGTVSGRASNWSHPSQWSGGASGADQLVDLGTVIKGRFVLESVLGQGGMGKVFKARDLRKEEAQDRNPYVAIKILNEDFKRHPRALQALQRESRKAQDLAHPNIVTVFDFDRDGDTVYMTMEYLDGESLDRFNRRHSPRGVPVDRALELVERLARGLMHAHTHGVVHSDFKPANAFLTKSGDVKIFDFGIARAAQQRADAEGDKTLFDAGELGALTPAYASCEMLEGGEPDPRDDIYALAVVAYELMGGRHPFDRKSAVKARDAGLQPAAIKGLSRRQWRALCRGLAFSREQRSASVEAFLEGIQPRTLKRGQLAAGAVAAAAVLVSVALLLPGYLDQRQVDSLIGTITNGPDVAITARLEELRELPAEQFRNVFLDDAVTIRFTDYYLRRIRELWDPSAERYRYDQATVMIDELGRLFPDSRRVGDELERLREERDNAVAELYQDLDRLRLAGRLIPQQGEDNVVGVLAALRHINPEDPRLSDGALPIRFAEVAAGLLEDGDMELASSVVDHGLTLSAEDVSLINLRDRIQNRRAQLDRVRRVAELESVITQRLAASSYGDDLRMLTASMLELSGLDPANAVLVQARSRIDELVVQQLDGLMQARDYDRARGMLESFAGVASADVLAAQQQKLAAGAAAFHSRLEGLLENLDDAIVEDRLDGGADSAVTFLTELERLGASSAQLTDARGRTAEGYAARGLKARHEGRWQDAEDAFNAGLALAPPPSVLQRLQQDLVLLAEYRLRAERSAESERQAMLTQARQAEIERLQARLRGRLEADQFSTSDARSALADLRSLDAYGAAPADGKGRIAARLQTEVERLAQAERWQDAVQLADQAVLLLPERGELGALRERVQADYDLRLASRQQQEIAALEEQLDALVSGARLDQAWDEQVRRLLGQYAAARGDEHADVVDARHRVAELFVADARRLRREERYENAVQQLDRAESHAPALASLAEERAALAGDRQALQQNLAARAREADIERLKNNLRAEAARSNPAAASDILDELRAKVPDDPFVTADGPRVIAGAYADMAREELTEGRLDQAQRLLALGRKYAPELAELAQVESDIAEAAADAAGARRLELESDRRVLTGIGEAVSGDGVLDVVAISAALNDIRGRHPELVAELEPALVRSALARLDALGGRDREAAVRRLDAARRIFPDDAALAGYRLPAAEPAAVADSCANPALVGNGSNRRATCRDALSADRQGPPLVVIPSGGPFSRPVAISKYEITIADYNNYCELSATCTPLDGQRTLPVTGISAAQAEAFVQWLAQTSGEPYRLPSGAEWEYAAYAAGQQPPKNFNCEVRQNNVPIKGISLVPVNSGESNGWGLMNYVGNAREWVKGGDGWHVRGGAHTTSMSQCDVRMESSHSGDADPVTGFRVLREIG